MAFTTLTDDLDIIASLNDLPNQDDGLTPTTLKQKFDEAGNIIKDYINDTLLVEIANTTAANKIGASTAFGSTIQSFITHVEAAGTGSVPPDSTISNAKLTSDVKIGSLASLTTTVKTSIQAAINELVSSISTINSSPYNNIPSGLISMWSGLISAIPTGWVLCDGNNSTPDLRDRFISGAIDQSEMNTSGGSTTKTLTTTELPSHTHSGTTSSAGEHSHNITVHDGGPYAGTYIGAGSTYGSYTGTTSTASSHTHTFTTSSTGSGSAFDIRPKYYKLAFIMKT